MKEPKEAEKRRIRGRKKEIKKEKEEEVHLLAEDKFLKMRKT